jgi:NTE family protein
MSTTTQFDAIERGTGSDRIGLALGGGGARGLAHILILEVFDELGLKPAMIAGTSIGAIFGGAYALGLSAAEIRERAEEILTNPAEIARRLFSGTPKDWMQLWTLRPFSASLMNAEKLIHIVLPEAEGAQFEQTVIPFKAATTDYREQKLVTLETGDMAKAIAASMALPSIFRAIEDDGHALADGGLVNPLPYDLLPRDCAAIVAIDVTGHLRLPEDRPPTALEAVLASSQIMQNAIVREKLKADGPDILIRPPVHEFRILEFYKIRAILEAALPIKEELKRGLDAKLSGVRERMI